MANEKTRKLLTSLGLVLATLALCLGLLEAGLRIIGRGPSHQIQGYFEQDENSYRLKKNASRVVRWPAGAWTVNTCELGYRSSQPGPRKVGDKPYVVIIGASEVFGNGLDYDQTFVGVFAQNMKRHSIEVINMGIGGHSLAEQVRLLKEFCASGKPPPSQVLICLNPLIMQEYDKDHQGVVVHDGNIFGKHWKKAYAKLVLENTCALYGFFRDRIRNIQQKHFAREDFAASYYVKMYATNNPLQAPERQEGLARDLKSLEEYIRSMKATPVYLYCPTSGGFMLAKQKEQGAIDGIDIDYFPRLAAAHCREAGLRFIDLTPVVRALFDKGEKLNIDLDSHFNAPTSRVVGEHMYNCLKPGAGSL